MSSNGCNEPSSLSSIALVEICKTLTSGRIPPNFSGLPVDISNCILDCLRNKKSLNNDTLRLLTTKYFRLTKADLSSSYLDIDSLQVFRSHPIVSINLQGTSFRGDKIMDVRKALTNMVNMDEADRVNFCNLGGARPLSNLLSVLAFSNLQSLTLFECNQMENMEFAIICRSMKQLKMLDISKTKITSISPIAHLKNLEVLLMHRVRIQDEKHRIVQCMGKLTNLKLLDCSVQRTDYSGEAGDHHPWTDLGLVILEEFAKKEAPCWPSLCSLDMAGYSLHGLSADGAADNLTQFVTLHTKLQEVSILDTPLDMFPYAYPGNRELTVYNAGTRQQSLNALCRYWKPERDVFTAHSLQAVYYLLQSGYASFTDEDIRKCVKGVEVAMRHHLHVLAIQMAGTACLYHLCKQKRIRRLLPREVYLCVERCLDAAEYYQNIPQLQKNVWLTICSDYLLQSSHLDFHRTCSVALESMVKNRDHSVSRMTIAIVSIVAPKVRSVDTKMLVASDQKYVSFFVKTINAHIDARGEGDNYSQFTLKFTLSALWNLTDECPKTCSLFLECGGLQAAFRALDFFGKNASIQTKVLGLLNNLAEVPEIQKALLQPEYLRQIIAMLDSGFDSSETVEGTDRRMDMSYFAAGILSNLLATNDWVFHPTPKMTNQALIETVVRWKAPKHTMVAYRSFTPFLSLLCRNDLPGIQMWSVWAIHHVCSGDKNRTNFRDYSSLVKTSGVVDVLSAMLVYPETHEFTYSLIEQILGMCDDKLMECSTQLQDDQLPRVEAQ